MGITNRLATADPGTTLGDLIHQRTADLTPAERRVAKMLFASNLMAGLEVLVAAIAGRLGDATHRRISTLEHQRKEFTWDVRDFPQGLEGRET